MKKEHLRLLPAVSLLFNTQRRNVSSPLCEALILRINFIKQEDEVHARYPFLIDSESRIQLIVTRFDTMDENAPLLYSLLL